MTEDGIRKMYLWLAVLLASMPDVDEQARAQRRLVMRILDKAEEIIGEQIEEAGRECISD